jgi:hypothetical protein
MGRLKLQYFLPVRNSTETLKILSVGFGPIHLSLQANACEETFKKAYD